MSVASQRVGLEFSPTLFVADPESNVVPIWEHAKFLMCASSIARQFGRSLPGRRMLAMPLFAWFAEVEGAQWNGPDDIKARHASASFLAGNRVGFNIKVTSTG
jgi:hypothetical protein